VQVLARLGVKFRHDDKYECSHNTTGKKTQNFFSGFEQDLYLGLNRNLTLQTFLEILNVTQGLGGGDVPRCSP